MALIEDHSGVKGEKERRETWDSTYNKTAAGFSLSLSSSLEHIC